MALQKLTYRPGLNREGTNYSNEGGFYDGDKIRFRSGQTEKIGGWVQASTNQFLGHARSLWTWTGLDGLASYIALGTELKFYLFYGGAYYDITPIIETNGTALSPPHALAASPISTVSGTKVVTITDGNYNPAVGDYVIIASSTAVGGLSINGEYVVKTAPTSTTYTIESATNASSTASGGGVVTIQYEYPIGLDVETVGTGWGAGPWGGGTGSNTFTLTGPFATSNTSSTITVTQTAHGLTTGQWVAFTSVGSNVSGISKYILQQSFQVTVLTANTYTISTIFASQTYTANATASSLGGTVVVSVPVAPTRGWGAGYSSGIAEQLRLWSNDNYGSDLVFAPRGGPIFYWQNVNGVSTRGKLLSDLSTLDGYDGDFVPKTTNQILTSATQQFVVALGANSYDPTDPDTPFNPMLVRWSDQSNPDQWVPEPTNQSGEFPLSNGSYIVAGRATRQEILVWTNSCLYSMQYVGYPYVFSFQVLMDNISIMAPNAAVTVNNVTYWMGKDKFYMYTGVVQTLPCSLRQYIFDNINTDQNFQVFAGSNEGYNEVWWFYVSKDSAGTTVDKYVIYNYLDKVWSYGNMSRTAWLQYGIQPNPLAADYNNRLLYHEIGNDDVSTASPQPIEAYVQSSDFGIDAGDHLGFVWRMLPDVNFNGSDVNNPSVTMTLYGRENSGSAYTPSDIDTVTSLDNYTSQGVYTVQKFDGQVYTRLRARQMAFNIRSTGLGVAWQLGIPRIDVKPAGRR
jgi:hypothetical protein